ncbi:MAG: DUF4935 domain-containing protein, partial [Proteobacteria bacterium]
MYFLIDVNVFIDYLKEAKDENFIDQIFSLAENRTIRLLIPDVLYSEWKNKKTSTLEYISKQFSAAATFSSDGTTSELLKTSYSHSRQRASLIDNLFERGLLLKTPQSVKAELVDRSLLGKAPFHDRKTKTINDCLFYFSAIHYLKKNKISSFVFITKDAGDFGATGNKNEILHPDLKDQSIETKYFTSLFKCFDYFKERMPVPKEEKVGDYQLVLLKRANKSLLNHLYDVLIHIKSKIAFLPTNILSRVDPFRIVDFKHDYAYHAGTTLLTNNKALVEFFETVDIAKVRFKKGAEYRNTKSNIEKLSYVISALNQN